MRTSHLRPALGRFALVLALVLALTGWETTALAQRAAPSAGPAPLSAHAVPAPYATAPPSTRGFASSTFYGVENTSQFLVQSDVVNPELNQIGFVTQGVFIGAGAIGADPDIAYYIDGADLFMADLTDSTTSYVGNFGTAPNIFGGMAYDPATDTFYGLTNTVDCLVPSILYELDVVNADAFLIGDTGIPCGIALSNGPGTRGGSILYAYDVVDDLFYTIDTFDGLATEVGPIGFDANFGQGMFWDPVNGAMFMTAFNNITFQSELRLVDPFTGNTTFISTIPPSGEFAQVAWADAPSGEGGFEPDEVLSPSAGDEFPRCRRVQITWDFPSLAPDDFVRITLLKGGVVDRVIAAFTPNDGGFFWRIPCDLMLGDDYQVRVAAAPMRGGGEATSGEFSIIPAEGILITAPAEGAEVEMGSTFEITWTSTGVSDSTLLNIILRNTDGAVALVARDTENDGSFEWSVPMGLEERGDYRLIVRYTGMGMAQKSISEVFSLVSGGVAAALRGGALPAELTLQPAYPNPMRGAGTLRFGLPEAADVTVEVYDVLGRRVAALAEGSREAGWHEVAVPASSLVPGVYVVRLVAGDRALVQRVTVAE